MSQKSYNLEIVGNLLKNNNHIRGLAKDLETNQTTISRKIRELGKENVVDFRKEGKNKVYFLKKTLEAKEYAYLTEHYKLLQLLKKYPLLKSIIQNIKSNNNIKLAILFGSYAKERAHRQSDIDLFVETEDRKLKKEIELINTKLSVKTGKYDPKNILIKEIEKDHVIIKGVELYYEKNQFFS
jgi:predicted nucleotidyltransferase